MGDGCAGRRCGFWTVSEIGKLGNVWLCGRRQGPALFVCSPSTIPIPRVILAVQPLVIAPLAPNIQSGSALPNATTTAPDPSGMAPANETKQ